MAAASDPWDVLGSPLSWPQGNSAIGDAVQFLSKVRGEPGKKPMNTQTAIRVFGNLKTRMPERAEMLLNDLFSAAINAGNLELAKWCAATHGGNADIYIQGRRFDPFRSDFLHRETEKNKPVLDWLWEQLHECDERERNAYQRVEYRFCRRLPGCDCRLCTATDFADLQEGDEPPVAIPFIGALSRGQLERLKDWLERLQQNKQVHKNHRNTHSEYLAAVIKYIKYLNRRYG